MNRFKWPVKFSSSMKWVKEKLKLLASTKFIKRMIQLPKMAILAVFLITILIGTNSLFWWYRANHGGFEFGGGIDKEPTKEWEIDMNEQGLDEEEIRKQYGVNDSDTSLIHEESFQQTEPEEPEAKTNENESINKFEDMEPVEEEPMEVVAVPTMTTMAMPTMGKVIISFAMDTLVYSKTLEQWNTHNGIDIAADVGTPVKAAMEGTVVEVINNDPRLGVVVIMDHGGGIKSLYGNLNSDKSVKKGDQIKKGQVIGAVGKTAPYEIEDPSHLHFEVLKDGKNIDPQQYLPNIR
jgi:biotin carboxyl carrier protein